MITAIKIICFVVRWTIIGLMFLAIEVQMKGVQDKVNLMKLVITVPPDSLELKDSYLLYGMNFTTSKDGFFTYSPAYVKLADAQDAYINKQVKYNTNINKKGASWKDLG